MRFRIQADLTYDFQSPSETLLLLEAARTTGQSVLRETLELTPAAAVTRRDDAQGGERRVVFTGEGRMRIRYEAEVEVQAHPAWPEGAPAPAIRDLPADVLRYLRPSRYCPSDRFEAFVEREFGHVAGGRRVRAILDWIAAHVDYRAGVSDAGSTALDTFVERAGVCRDFAHLAIAFCRAGDIPARAVSAHAWKLDPPDLHAVIEVHLDGDWWLLDPTGLAPVEGLVRVATGLDAADIAFMSIFGEAAMVDQRFAVQRIDGEP
ncbi:MAG: transglutaminase family protein [Pseudomonadota bacterium]